MEKICLIAFHDLYLMQFLYKYTEILDANNIEYDVIYWERERETGYVRPMKGTRISFQYETSYYGSKLGKVAGYLKYIAFVRKVLKENNYKKAILFTTQAALPMYLFSRRIRKKIRYIYDYRDITYENNVLLKKVIQKIIKKSYFTSISSCGFEKKLGESNKFVMAHNISEKLVYMPVHKTTAAKIRIVYWGMVRQVEFNKKVIQFFGNDPRFELVYHGAGYVDDLEDFCQQNGYSNVTFTGKYTTNEISCFADNTDILLNMYENDYQQQLATTVKLYDGMRYGLPMLITQGSYMAELMKNQNYVLAIDLVTDSLDMVFNWYSNLEAVSDAYRNEINNINTEDEVFRTRLLEFVRM